MMAAGVWNQQHQARMTGVCGMQYHEDVLIYSGVAYCPTEAPIRTHRALHDGLCGMQVLPRQPGCALRRHRS